MAGTGCVHGAAEVADRVSNLAVLVNLDIRSSPLTAPLFLFFFFTLLQRFALNTRVGMQRQVNDRQVAAQQRLQWRTGQVLCIKDAPTRT